VRRDTKPIIYQSTRSTRSTRSIRSTRSTRSARSTACLTWRSPLPVAAPDPVRCPTASASSP
jgi:hypothetical protein